MPKTTTTKKELIVDFKLHGIELLEVCVTHPKQPDQDLKVAHFDINIEHRQNPATNLLTAIITIDLFNNQRVFKLGSITASCTFEIANIHEFKDKKSTRFLFPDTFLITINAITISTTRGIMFNQFKGTFLQNAILPIVDPRSYTKP